VTMRLQGIWAEQEATAQSEKQVVATSGSWRKSPYTVLQKGSHKTIGGAGNSVKS